MFTSLALVAGLLVAAAPADPSGAAAPELTLQYRMAPETGFEQGWRPSGPRLTLGANVPYELRVLLDGDAFWARDVELSHWEGATASPPDEGSVTATLVVPVAMDVEVGVAVLVSGEGLAHTLTSFTSVRTVDVLLPPPPGKGGGKQQAQAPGGGFGPGRPNNEVVGVQARGQTGGCSGITETTFAWLYDTGVADAACAATGNAWAVSVAGPVRCPGGLSKVYVRDQYGLDADGLRSRLLRNARWAIADAARALHKLHGESSAGAMTPDVVRHDDGHSLGPVTRADDARWLQKLIDTLDGSHAQVLRLRMQGRSFHEIGAVLEERPATVRQRYHRAYNRLADLVRWAEQEGCGGDDA
jgi:hypothetical protein